MTTPSKMNDVLKQIAKMARDPNKCMRGDIAVFAENSMITKPTEQAMREILLKQQGAKFFIPNNKLTWHNAVQLMLGVAAFQQVKP